MLGIYFPQLCRIFYPRGKENYQKCYIYAIERRMLSYLFAEQTTKKISQMYSSFIMRLIFDS